jgi:hypothetical protein
MKSMKTKGKAELKSWATYTISKMKVKTENADWNNEDKLKQNHEERKWKWGIWLRNFKIKSLQERMKEELKT